MREHEVPTHVQAEDRVLLWFTFPQIVAVTAVCALSYGAYSYAPVGPTSVRIGLAALLCVVGIAMIVGKIGGRSLPLVVADLLRYRLGGRCYAGPVSELTRSEPPPAPESAPNPLAMLARRAGRGSRRMRVMVRRGLARMRRHRGGNPFDLTCGSGNAVNQSRQTVASNHGEARPASPVEPRPQVTFFVW